jgi:2-polyprenyl-3-methyl-5-hydroxy-6-metoxy-1,4-benzoquinol methylase
MIRTEEIKNCIVCGKEGKVLYEKLKDNLFGVSGEFGFRKCNECDIIWQSPRPVKEDIHLCYKNHFTHSIQFPPQKERVRRFSKIRDILRNAMLSEIWGYKQFDVNKWWASILARFFYLIPPLRERARFKMGDFFLPFIGKGRLLEIGCGNGGYLSFMKKLGWNVKGIEMDKEAVKIAREHYGIDVIEGDAETFDFGKNSFDAIVMFHVIEHLYNPLKMIKKCYEALSEGGIIFITTPNTSSFGHKIFKGNWIGLDPPRHIFIFSRHSLQILFERAGFKISKIYTRPLYFMFEKSLKEKDIKKAKLFFDIEKIFKLFNSDLGEETILIGRKYG